MNEHEEIPVLNTLRERLVEAIAAHGGGTRHRGLAVVAVVALVVAGASVWAWAARSPSAGHPVAVSGPAHSGQPLGSVGAGSSTRASSSSPTQPISGTSGVAGTSGGAGVAGTSGASGSSAAGTTNGASPPGNATNATSPTTGARPAPAGSVPATTVPPARTTSTTRAASGPTITVNQTQSSVTVAVGTTIVVQLGNTGGACGLAYGPPASSNGAVVSPVGGSDFRAVATGTARLSAAQSPMSSQKAGVCPAIGNDVLRLWTLTVTVD